MSLVQAAQAQPACLLPNRECPISHGPCPGECVFANVMQSANLGIVLFDLENRSVLFQNDEAVEQLEGAAPARDYQALYGLLLQGVPELVGGEPFSPKPVRVGSRLLGYRVYRGGRFVWMFIRDITEKARLEAVAEAVELMNDIGYIFSAVRHEIGNPINSIKTALAVLRNNAYKFPRETILDYIDRSLAEVARVEDLLASLKSFSMYEDCSPQDQELEPFLRKTLQLMGPEFEKRGIRGELALAEGAQRARFDPRALHQVMLNLLTNAADALEGRADGLIQIRTQALGGVVGVLVEDNGCGMTEAQEQQLFKPFVTSKPSGTGLGLVISRKLMARMGGTIGVEAAADGGTVVGLSLPEASPVS